MASGGEGGGRSLPRVHFRTRQDAEPLVEAATPLAVTSPTKGGTEERRVSKSTLKGPQEEKYKQLLSMLMLNRFFGYVGYYVSLTPYAFIVSALIISSLSVGIFRVHLRDRVRDGYTPRTSESRHETDVLRSFFGLQSDPVFTIVLMIAKDGGSMHRPEHMAEALRVHRHIQTNVNVTVAGRSLAFKDFCGSFCYGSYFFEYFASELVKLANGVAPKPSRGWSSLDFPITNVHGVDMHFERNFFGVRTVNSSSSSRAVADNEDPLRAVHRFTNVRSIEVVQLDYHGEPVGDVDEETLAAWEMQLYHFVMHQFHSDLVELQVLGSEIVDFEMNADSQLMIPYNILGFASMIAFAFLTTMASSFFYDASSGLWTILIVLACVACSGLSVAVTIGVYGLIGMRINSVMLIMPFLTLGIGVNDSFIMAHAYFRNFHRAPSRTALMRLVYGDIGPSVTITTLTNVVTFLIGALAPTAEIQLFCVGAACALGVSYIFTLILFGPVLAVVFDPIRAKNQLPSDGIEKWLNGQREQFEKVLNCFVSLYARILCSKLFHLLNAVVYGAFVGFALYGTLNISARLDTEKILPHDSRIRRPHEIIAHKVWHEYYPMQLFLTKPFNLTDTAQVTQYNQMMDEFAAMQYFKGKKYTMNWFTDYKRYFDDNIDGFDFDFHSDTGVSEDLGPRPATGYDARYLARFLASPMFAHYNSVVKWRNDGDWRHSVIDQFTLTLVYAKVPGWDGRIEIMQAWREIARRYADSLGAVVWETNGMFVDQMLSLKDVSMNSAIWAIVCMLIVCTIFIRNPMGIVTAVCAIGSIALGVIGYLYYWGMDLDPVSLGAILMSVGMSVDFTVHSIYAYLRKERVEFDGDRESTIKIQTTQERVENCINSVMFPILQGGMSTMLCVLPLLFIPDYIPMVFLKTIVLVVIFGFYHGCVVIPGAMVVCHKPVNKLVRRLCKSCRSEESVQQQPRGPESQPLA